MSFFSLPTVPPSLQSCLCPLPSARTTPPCIWRGSSRLRLEFSSRDALSTPVYRTLGRPTCAIDSMATGRKKQTNASSALVGMSLAIRSVAGLKMFDLLRVLPTRKVVGLVVHRTPRRAIAANRRRARSLRCVRPCADCLAACCLLSPSAAQDVGSLRLFALAARHLSVHDLFFLLLFRLTRSSADANPKQPCYVQSLEFLFYVFFPAAQQDRDDVRRSCCGTAVP